MLPHVLRFSAGEITGKLATLALRAKLGNEGESEEELADRFLDSVEALADSVGIPRHLDALRERDIAALAEAACWEADTNYPVPRRMTQADCETILRSLLPDETAARAQPAARAPTRKAPAKKAPAKKGPAKKTARRRPSAG